MDIVIVMDMGTGGMVKVRVMGMGTGTDTVMGIVNLLVQQNTVEEVTSTVL